MGSTPPLAALTTVFTPPCQTSWLIETSKIPSQYPPFPTSGPVSCDPPEWAANIADKGFQYYSPAICPSGFEVGPDCEVEDTRIAEEEFPAVAPGEQAFYCVPSGYSCTSDTTDFRGGIWGYTVAGATGGKSVDCTVGPALQIRWKEEDLEVLATHPLTPGLARDGGTTAQPSPTRATTDEETTTVEARPDTTSEPETIDMDMTETTAMEIPEMTEQPEQPAAPTRFLTVVTTLILSGGSMSISTVTQGVSGTSSYLSEISQTTASGSDSSSTPVSSMEANGGGGRISNNPMALATVLVSSLFVGSGLIAIAYVMLRRYRKRMAELGEGPTPVGVGAWIQRSGERVQSVAELQGSPPAWPTSRMRAELGTDGPTPELSEQSPFGTIDNPAELDSHQTASRHRWSWLSHVSERLSTRSKKSSRAPSRNRSTPRRTLSEASNSSTSTVSSVNSEKALLPHHGSR